MWLSKAAGRRNAIDTASAPTTESRLEHLADLKDWLIELARQNAGLAVPIAFGLGFAESVVVLAWLVPSSAILVAIGALQQSTGGGFWPPWIAAAAGALLGDVASFAVGWYYRHEIKRMWPFSDRPQWIVATRVVLRRWGYQGIIASKFFGPLRSCIPVVAGAAHMKWRRFVPASALSCLIWSGVFTLPGYGLLAVFG